MVIRSSLVFVILLVLLAGCGAKGPQLRKAKDFASPAEKKVLYVVPFVTVMVPGDVEEGTFDRFVDLLNAGAQPKEFDFVILKEDLEKVDPAWLKEQNYLTGEIYGYVEDTGCCSTNIRVKSRLELHQPGLEIPTLTLEYPLERYFEHDYTSIPEERRKLAEVIASTLANQLLDTLAIR